MSESTVSDFPSADDPATPKTGVKARTTVAIEVHDLSKRYGSPRSGHSVLALDHVSLTIPSASIFGLLGPNGAGKTTLIKVLTGISDITAGNAKVAGFDVQTEAMQERARIGWVAAEVILDDDFSVWENLWFQAKLQGLTGWEDRASQLLDYFALKDYRNDRTNHLSSGMRKKLEIALALLHQPSVIFMDEPTIGLDVGTRHMLWDIVTGVRKEFGVTILLTTHYIEEADILCDRVAIIDKGRIIAEGTPSELKARVRGDVIELEMSGELDVKAIQAVAGVREVKPMGPGWQIRVDSSEAFLPRMFGVIPTGAIKRINVEKPSLETVFIELTGKRLGAEEQPMGDIRKFYAEIRRVRG